MGGGSSVLFRKKDSAKDVKGEEPLPYLNSSSKIAEQPETPEITSPETLKRNKLRFQRLLKMMRQESTLMDDFNKNMLLQRKRKMIAIVEEAVHREKVLHLQEKRDQEIKEDLHEGRQLLFSMLNYDLSSSDDEEELHDVNRPRTTESMTEGCSELQGTDGVIDGAICELENDNHFNCNDDHEGGSSDCSYSISIDSDESSDKDDAPRPSSEVENGISRNFDYVPRHQSILHNKATAKLKKQQHKLHSIMRQESLEARQARANQRLRKRLRNSQNRKPVMTVVDETHQNDIETNESRRDSISKDIFEAKKNVMKEFKAYDDKRRESVQNRYDKHRDALNRRLEKRKQEAGRLLKSDYGERGTVIS